MLVGVEVVEIFRLLAELNLKIQYQFKHPKTKTKKPNRSQKINQKHNKLNTIQTPNELTKFIKSKNPKKKNPNLEWDATEREGEYLWIGRWRWRWNMHCTMSIDQSTRIK